MENFTLVLTPYPSGVSLNLVCHKCGSAEAAWSTEQKPVFITDEMLNKATSEHVCTVR